METQNQIIKGNKLINFKKKLSDQISVIILVVISIAYTLKGVFSFEPNHKSIEATIGETILNIVVGFTIYACLRTKGIKAGRNDDCFIASLQLYGEAKSKIKENQFRLPAFCSLKSEQELIEAKREAIENVGLNYNLFLKGIYNKENFEVLELDQEQIDIINNIDKVKIERMRSEELLSDLPRTSKKDYGRYGKGVKEYNKETRALDLSNLMLYSVIFARFGLKPLLNSDNLSNVLWSTLQLLLWLAFGIIKYVSAMSFMVNEYRQTHIIQKTEYLNEFISLLNSKPEDLDKFDYTFIIQKNIGTKVENISKLLKESENNGD